MTARVYVPNPEPARELTPVEKLGREFPIGSVVAIELDDHRAHGGTYVRKRSFFDGERQRNVIVLKLLGTKNREVEIDVERIANVIRLDDSLGERFSELQRRRATIVMLDGQPVSFAQIAERLGLSHSRIYGRRRRWGDFRRTITESRRDQRPARRRPALGHESIAALARSTGVSYRVVYERLERGLPPEVVTSPLMNPRAPRYEFAGQQLTLGELARATGIAKNTLYARLRAGLSLEQATTVAPSKSNRWRKKD